MNELLKPSLQRLGAFDHLVFTAGDSLHLNDLATTDLKRARSAFDLRYWAELAAIKYGSSHIRKGGSVVSDHRSRRPASAQGMGSCSKCLRNYRSLDARARNRVGADSCQRYITGVVRTNLWQNMSADAREQQYESVGKNLPVGRVGEAHDIAQAYLFLMQEGFSTGQAVVVDG